MEPKSFTYKTKVTWLSDKKVETTVEGKPPLKVATPPEFGGPEGIWSPEELFLASINSCLLTTFLAIAERHNLRFISYESYAEGTVEMSGGRYMFTRVILRPKITVDSQEMAPNIRRALEGAEKRCFISNSVKSQVTVEPQVKVVNV